MHHPPQAQYGINPRGDLAPFIPTHVRRVLDIGCGEGGFAMTLRRVLGDGAYLAAVEAVPESVHTARSLGYDVVHQGYFPDAVPDGEESFDLITFNDVLEHMLDPVEALRAARRYLAPGGTLMASIPNVQHLPVVRQLIRGRWDYTDNGVLDRTHVRFFTRGTMVELFEEAGFGGITTTGINGFETRFATDPVAPRRWLKLRSLRLLGDANFEQFVVSTSDQDKMRTKA